MWWHIRNWFWTGWCALFASFPVSDVMRGRADGFDALMIMLWIVLLVVHTTHALMKQAEHNT